jgi:DNA polymerase I
VRKLSGKEIFLIDGSSLLYRSYYGLRPLYTAKGVPTQAVYGFCRAIKKLEDDFDPKYMVVVWDSKGKTFRNEIFKEYKATRQPAPSDLFEQKEKIIEFLKLVDIEQVSKTGYEADDLLYSIVEDYKKDDVVLICPDKDLQQMISDHVVVFDPIKKEWIDHNSFVKKRGFAPEKLNFYHSLLGDSSDNIPGVKGVGKKGAEELVKQFDSLDDLYENIKKVKTPRAKTALEKHKEEAFLSRKLFTLKYYDVKVNKKDMAFDKTKWANAVSFFNDMEFKSFIPAGYDKKQQGLVQRSIFDQSDLLKEKSTDIGTKGKRINNWKFTTVYTEKELYELCKELKEKKFFAFDTETTGLKPLYHDLVGMSFAVSEKKAFYVPVGHTAENSEKQLPFTYVIEKLKPIFENSSIKKTLQHAKFDQLVLWKCGVEVKGVEFDTLLAANLLREEWDKIGLKSISVKYLNEYMDSFNDVLGKKLKTFAQVDIEKAVFYATHDAIQTFKLKTVLEKLLKKEKKLQHIFEKIEMPLSLVLFQMERTGIGLDVDVLEKVHKQVKKELDKIENKIAGVLDHKKTEQINLNSPKQMETLLFDVLNLKVVKKSSKGKRSTDQEVLNELSKVHPIPGLILKYRALFKLKSTYLEPLPLCVNEKTKRIHTSFSQTIVATGRLSSFEPNLQNIPASENFGVKIRSAFVAPRGRKFISADYSQIELRVLAHITKDENLTRAFLENKDIHKQTASQIFDVPEKKVTHEQRQIGKRINFSIIYGLTPYGLSRDLGIKPNEAKIYIEKYFEQYPKVAEWIERTVEDSKEAGYTQTWLGRRRYISGLKEKNKNLYEAARRIATNSPIQGTSAEIVKLAMICVYNELRAKKINAELILQIHDELVVEVDSADEKRVSKIIESCMENVVDWEIPLTVALRSGKNWGQITK